MESSSGASESRTPDASVAAVGAAQYVQLITFRKDGTGVPTPVWAVPEGDALLVWTTADAWKVRRVRRDPWVSVQACDARGRKLHGPIAYGRAEIVTGADADAVRAAIVRKYGLMGRLTILGSRLRRGNDGTVGLRIVGEGTADDA